jgi:hypothetical protein
MARSHVPEAKPFLRELAMKTRRGKPRAPLRERFWRRTIADQTQSDLTISAYCQRNSLSLATFRFWRQELARRGAERTSVRTGERPASSTDLERTPAFLPVHVVQDSTGHDGMLVRKGRYG